MCRRVNSVTPGRLPTPRPGDFFRSRFVWYVVECTVLAAALLFELAVLLRH